MIWNGHDWSMGFSCKPLHVAFAPIQHQRRWGIWYHLKWPLSHCLLMYTIACHMRPYSTSETVSAVGFSLTRQLWWHARSWASHSWPPVAYVHNLKGCKYCWIDRNDSTYHLSWLAFSCVANHYHHIITTLKCVRTVCIAKMIETAIVLHVFYHHVILYIKDCKFCCMDLIVQIGGWLGQESHVQPPVTRAIPSHHLNNKVCK
jgi:hypothetical protein